MVMRECGRVVGRLCLGRREKLRGVWTARSRSARIRRGRGGIEMSRCQCLLEGDRPWWTFNAGTTRLGTIHRHTLAVCASAGESRASAYSVATVCNCPLPTFPSNVVIARSLGSLSRVFSLARSLSPDPCLSRPVIATRMHLPPDPRRPRAIPASFRVEACRSGGSRDSQSVSVGFPYRALGAYHMSPKKLLVRLRQIPLEYRRSTSIVTDQ
ncbi:hypothetical protein C8Q74DRAFT_479682 [Fomes fomentarius]|nr:hypothetical protein C8Q74DRAFT_479682 [Fomes fomentarius]